MANYSVLKAAVEAVVKTNGNQEITGANMQDTLLSIIDSFGSGYQFMGVATPSTNPGTPDQKVFYIAAQAGVYDNFGSSVNVYDSVQIFAYDTSWHTYDTGIPIRKSVSAIDFVLDNSTTPVTVEFSSLLVHSTDGIYLVEPPTGQQKISVQMMSSSNSYLVLTKDNAVVSRQNNASVLPSDTILLEYNATAKEWYRNGELYDNIISSSPSSVMAMDFSATDMSVTFSEVVVKFNGENGLKRFYANNGHTPETFTFQGGADANEILVLHPSTGTFEILSTNASLQTDDIILLRYIAGERRGGLLLPQINQQNVSTAVQSGSIPLKLIDNVSINYSTGAAQTGTTVRGTDYIDVSGLSRIVYSRGVTTSTTSNAGMAFYSSSKTYISGERFVRGSDSLGYTDSVIYVPSTAQYARFTFWKSSEVEESPFVADYFSEYQELRRSAKDVLQGKKISIIGDSISCFGTESQTRNDGYNAPYWIVKTVDVGTTIQSWVTWLDVYTSVNGTTPTGKTIGGISLTPAMIGTKQSFSPVAADVGKEIGVARWAGSYTSKPWWQVLIDGAGATLCNNASWSGSRIVPIPEGNDRHDAFVLSEAYSEYTIGRVANRDDEGNTVNPDVIIIYRGTNDYMATDPEGGSGSDDNESIDTPDMMTFDGITDTHNFTQGYIWTILKLREKYPSAYIILCTLNFFKSGNVSKYPPNNGTYTLIDYNNKIREIADIMGCGIIELDKDGITYENCYPTYISDSSTTPIHPNTTGHKVMGERALRDVRYTLNS